MTSLSQRPFPSLDLTPEQRLSGEYDYGIIALRGGDGDRLYAAWTKTWEGPARPDRIAALADLNGRLRPPVA